MLISELWAQINTEVRNFGALKETEAITFINQAIDYCNDFLIAAKDPTLCKDISITTGMAKPSDWGKSAGTFPFHFNGDTFVADISPGPVKARYFARKPRITAMTDTWPFTDDIASLAVKWAATYAINRAEGDTANDERIIAARENKSAAARGA
jgi:hypothetical protein